MSKLKCLRYRLKTEKKRGTKEEKGQNSITCTKISVFISGTTTKKKTPIVMTCIFFFRRDIPLTEM